MLSSLTLTLVLGLAAPAAAPAKPTKPPAPKVTAQSLSPKAAARASTKTALPSPRALPAKKGDGSWLPAPFSLTQDPNFTPWSSFLTLGDDRLGRWTLEGTSLGSGLHCEDTGGFGCVPLAQATAAVAWQPHGTPIGFFAGLTTTAMPRGGGGGMGVRPGFVAGLRISPTSMVAAIRRIRARRD